MVISMDKMKLYTVIDLFAGAGGLSEGFVQAGFVPIAHVEMDKDACNTLRTRCCFHYLRANNHLDVYYKYLKGEINRETLYASVPAEVTNAVINVEISDKTINDTFDKIKLLAKGRKIDMIIGGPPCQDFSSAGKRNEDNGRGDLTVAYARIIAEVRPTWFVMENVERILKTQKLVDALEIFHAAGYGTSYTVLNAALCGVPQKRKRFVMIGKLGAENDFMQETIRENLSDHEMSVAEYFGDKLDIQYYYRHPRSYVRRGIFSTAEPSATIRGVNRPMPQGYQLHPGDPVDSLEGIRPLTTHERSMIQTFPEDFNFEGTKTNIEQMIGNAVPVNLGYFVADAIFRYSGEKRLTYTKHRIIKQLNFLDLFDQYELEPITQNFLVREDDEIEYGKKSSKHDLPLDLTKNLLICNVKKDNWEQYLDGTAKIYYTGKKFPTTVALNKLYYFMP